MSINLLKWLLQYCECSQFRANSETLHNNFTQWLNEHVYAPVWWVIWWWLRSIWNITCVTYICAILVLCISHWFHVRCVPQRHLLNLRHGLSHVSSILNVSLVPNIRCMCPHLLVFQSGSLKWQDGDRIAWLRYITGWKCGLEILPLRTLDSKPCALS